MANSCPIIADIRGGNFLRFVYWARLSKIYSPSYFLPFCVVAVSVLVGSQHCCQRFAPRSQSRMQDCCKAVSWPLQIWRIIMLTTRSSWVTEERAQVGVQYCTLLGGVSFCAIIADPRGSNFLHLCLFVSTDILCCLHNFLLFVGFSFCIFRYFSRCSSLSISTHEIQHRYDDACRSCDWSSCT